MESRDYSLFRPYLSLFIILPPQKEKEYGELADMVKEVNATQVSVEERLSDHVYVYSKREGSLKIAV